MSQENITTFKRLLTEGNYRITKARLRTFKLLLNSEPQSMNQLIAKSNGNPDRVSLYRNIELFEEIGVVNRIYTGWKYKLELSEEFIGHHHHMTCVACGISIDIEDEEHVDEFINSVAEQVGFVPKRHVFEIEGYCQNCATSEQLADQLQTQDRKHQH